MAAQRSLDHKDDDDDCRRRRRPRAGCMTQQVSTMNSDHGHLQPSSNMEKT